jgi:hypothetical protein
MENASDEPRCVFIALQWQLIIHFLFEVREQTQIKALKYVSCVQRESDYFHPVICEHLQCLQLYMNGTIVHEQLIDLPILHSTVVRRYMEGEPLKYIQQKVASSCMACAVT